MDISTDQDINIANERKQCDQKLANPTIKSQRDREDASWGGTKRYENRQDGMVEIAR